MHTFVQKENASKKAGSAKSAFPDGIHLAQVRAPMSNLPQCAAGHPVETPLSLSRTALTEGGAVAESRIGFGVDFAQIPAHTTEPVRYGPNRENGIGCTESELTTGGSALSEIPRRFYEIRMGHDLAAVRLHRGDRARQLCGALTARAFTFRNHIWLGQQAGDGSSHTVAHELTHVVQQTSPDKSVPTGVSSAPPSIQRDLDPPGNCVQGIHDSMQRLVKAWCDHPSGRACTAADTCHRIQQKIRRNQLCAQHRRTINDVCYNGGDLGHRIAERDARAAQSTCMALFRVKCTPQVVRDPVRVPVQKTVPRTNGQKIAEWAEEVVTSGRDATEAAEEFLRNNPELVAVIAGAGIAAILLLIADDATLVGFADDVLIPVIAALEWVALRMSFGF